MSLTPSARYLFLQGPASLFFSRLGAALQRRGHIVFRINFNGGDRAFWRGANATDFLGGKAEWPAFFRSFVREHEITDIMLLGDCRPLHRLAIEAAQELGLKKHIFESGYIRPNWITMEQQGVNGYSSLPRTAEEFLRLARGLPAPMEATQVKETLPRRSVDDVIYTSATALMSWRYREYRRDWPYGQAAEYAFGGLRQLRRIVTRRRVQKTLDQMTHGTTPFYLLPLQIEADSQIRFHSPYAGQEEAIHLVIQSFARSAPADARLVITEHPLETCPTSWQHVVNEQTALHGVAARVAFLTGGTPPCLVKSCRGMLVLNSSTGQDALALHKPLIALATAVFALPGLTFQGDLDAFWNDAAPPDPELVFAFRQVMIANTQINGGFFSDAGIALAIKNIIPKLEQDIQAAYRQEAPEIDLLSALHNSPNF